MAPLDLSTPHVSTRIQHIHDTFPEVVGFRPRFSEFFDADGRLDEESSATLASIAEHELTLDCLVGGAALAAVPVLARACPELHLIINHGGDPEIDGKEPFETWVQAMAAIAKAPNAYCKVSGLFTLVPPDTSRRAVAAHIDVLLALFGAERLMWGSDWPVLTQVGSYGDWLDFCRTHFAGYPASTPIPAICRHGAARLQAR